MTMVSSIYVHPMSAVTNVAVPSPMMLKARETGRRSAEPKPYLLYFAQFLVQTIDSIFVKFFLMISTEWGCFGQA